MDEWICEQHPELERPHGDCAGPGVLKEEQIFYMWLQRRNALQQLKETKAFYEQIIYGLYKRVLTLEEQLNDTSYTNKSQEEN